MCLVTFISCYIPHFLTWYLYLPNIWPNRQNGFFGSVRKSMIIQVFFSIFTGFVTPSPILFFHLVTCSSPRTPHVTTHHVLELTPIFCMIFSILNRKIEKGWVFQNLPTCALNHMCLLESA